MKSLTPATLDSQILERVVAPDEPTLPLPVARALVKLSFDAGQEQEIHSLLDRNNEGTLTDAERGQLEAYVRVGNFLSLLQAKARATLSRKRDK